MKCRINQKSQENKKIIVCDECKYEFLLNAVNIQCADLEIKNQQLVLHFFICPKCKKVYKILLCDEHYNELKEDFEAAKLRLQKSQAKGNKELVRTLEPMIRKKFERLKNHENKLNKTFNGTFVVASENNNTIIKYLP